MSAADPELMQRARQGLYWRLMSALFEQGDAAPNLESLARELANTTDLPVELLDPKVTVDVLVHRFPKLKPEFSRPLPGFEPPTPDGEAQQPSEGPTDLKSTVQRALVVSKLLLNAFGPNTQGSVTAQQYGAWARDVEWLEGRWGCRRGRCGRAAMRRARGRRRAGAARRRDRRSATTSSRPAWRRSRPT
ncbi:hypothetical protein [Nannocystis pusilla]|uniref:hypothetical protein n=1 Tax=Nannocystis pusilla TaxID=889268 RepID=UPI003B7D979E